MNNAEFLNKKFGINYESWDISLWQYSKNIVAWMIDLSDTKTYKFLNYEKILISKTLIGPGEENIIVNHSYFTAPYRYIFDKSNNYAPVGLFMIDKDGGLDEFYVLKQVPHMVIEMIYEDEERHYC